MGSGSSKSSEVTKAENYSKESLADSSTSFSVVNLHGTSTAGGVLLVILILALACLGYGVKWYKDRLGRLRHRAATTLDVTV